MLSKEPFDVMVTGEKTTEFRKPSKWILSRIEGKNFEVVKFVNGYGKDNPYFIAKFRGWEKEINPYEVTYSNGLRVKSDVGTIKIYIGEIIEKGNLSS